MNTVLRTTVGLLAFGLAIGVTSVQAATGITRSQELAIKIGMSYIEVEQVLGRPAVKVKYRNAPGPSWTYHVAGASYENAEFSVDFGSDGTVISAHEFSLPSGS